jgi:hypothetical protein
LNAEELKSLIKKVTTAGGDIQKFLDGVKDEIKAAKKAAKEAAEKAAKEAAEKAAKEAAEKAAKEVVEEAEEGFFKKVGKRFGRKMIPIVGQALMIKGAYDGWSEGEGFFGSFWGGIRGALW